MNLCASIHRLEHGKGRGERIVCSLDKWFYDNGNVILTEETDHIEYVLDLLFSLVPRVKSPLCLLLERSSPFPLSRVGGGKTLLSIQ